MGFFGATLDLLLHPNQEFERYENHLMGWREPIERGPRQPRKKPAKKHANRHFDENAFAVGPNQQLFEQCREMPKNTLPLLFRRGGPRPDGTT